MRGFPRAESALRGLVDVELATDVADDEAHVDGAEKEPEREPERERVKAKPKTGSLSRRWLSSEWSDNRPKSMRWSSLAEW